MLPNRLFIVARSILVGWGTLFALTDLVERPLLIWTIPLLGSHWVATAKLSLDCLALAATGWLIGRLHRPAPLLGVLAFAATLAFCNLDPLLDTNVLWLIRLAADAVRDTHYLGSFATTTAQYLFLFGSLIVGALLSRPSSGPLSLFRENLR
jgi:hypothetical protein